MSSLLQCVNEIINVLFRKHLGDRDQHMVFKGRIDQAEIVAAQETHLKQMLIDMFHFSRQRTTNSWNKVPIRKYRKPREIVNHFCCIMGFLITKVSNLFHSLLSKQAHVNGCRERHQTLVSANIGGCFLAAYVLLTCGKRQDVTTSSFRICCFSNQTARNFPYKFFPCCEEPQV